MIIKNELIEKLEIDKERVVFDVFELENLLVKAYRLGFKDGFDFYKVKSNIHRIEADQIIQDHFNFVYHEE